MSSTPLTLPALKDILRLSFRGPHWQDRFLIGVALSLLGLIVPLAPGIFQYGYFARLLRQSIKEDTLELPAWDDWGKLGLDGLRMFGVSLIYLLPGYLVMFGGMVAYFIGSFAMIPLMEAAERNPALAMQAPLWWFGLIGILMLSIAVSWLLFFLGAVPLPVALARAAEQEKFSAAFQLGDIHNLLRRNASGYFLLWVILIGLFTILYFICTLLYMTFIFMWLIFVVALPLSFYLLVVAAALFGQTYRESLALAAAAALPAAPPEGAIPPVVNLPTSLE
jgi:hypothetical protein